MASDLEEVRGCRRGVDVVFASARIDDESGRFELGEVGGDAALAHREDRLEVGHGERFLCKEAKDSEACGVRKHF